MRTFVLVIFFYVLVSATSTLLLLVLSEEKKWTRLFDFVISGGIAVWAAWLLWQ